MKNRIPHITFALGAGLLSFVFFSIFFPATGFIIHVTTTPIWILAAAIVSCIITYSLLPQQKTLPQLLWLILLPVIVFGCVFVASQTLDSSWDGNAYHKTAIGALKNGWNPVYESIDDFNISANNPVKVSHPYSEWNDHYPKASWIFAASIYQLTGNIESGRSLLLLSCVILFLFSFSYLRTKLSLNKALLVSIVMAGNPIAIMQFFSYYNDGILGNLILVTVILLTILIDKKPFIQPKIIYLMVFFALSVLVNLKFTGLVYAGIYALCYYIYLFTNFSKHKKLIQGLTLTGAAVLVIGVFVIGLSTYPKNLIANGNPFYPLYGSGAVDIITANQPVSFSDNNRLENFIRSNLSYTENINANGAQPQLKIPFAIRLSELSNFRYPDLRIAGYGVWFGGLLIASFFAGIYLLIRQGRRYRQYLPQFIIPIIATGIIIIAFKDAWWARYLPQLFIIPIAVIVASFVLKAKIIPYILICMLLFNNILVGIFTIDAQQQFITESEKYKATLSSCPQLKYIYANNLDGGLYNLIDTYPSLNIVSPKEGRSASTTPTQVWHDGWSHKPCV